MISARLSVFNSNYVPRKNTKCLLAISSRSAVAASAGVPSKGVIVEADSLEKDTGNNIALLAKGLVQAGDETIKDSSSATRPGIRGYSFGREEGKRGYSFAREEMKCSNPNSCTSNSDCCGDNCCLTTGACYDPEIWNSGECMTWTNE